MIEAAGQATVAAALQHLLDTQRDVSAPVPGCIPTPGEPIDHQQVAIYAFALAQEVHELANELGWKPWKLSKAPDHERVADEFADVLAFVGVMLNHIQHLTGITMLELAAQYQRKSDVNRDRIAGKVAGYGIAHIRTAT